MNFSALFRTYKRRLQELTSAPLLLFARLAYVLSSEDGWVRACPYACVDSVCCFSLTRRGCIVATWPDPRPRVDPTCAPTLRRDPPAAPLCREKGPFTSWRLHGGGRVKGERTPKLGGYPDPECRSEVRVPPSGRPEDSGAMPEPSDYVTDAKEWGFVLQTKGTTQGGEGNVVA